MSVNLKLFLEKVSNDETLKAELDEALEGIEGTEQLPAMLEFAKKKGLSLTREDFESNDADLGLDELENVSGAGSCQCNMSGTGSGDLLKCSCNNYGEGSLDYPYTKQCGCTYQGMGGGCKCFSQGIGMSFRR